MDADQGATALPTKHNGADKELATAIGERAEQPPKTNANANGDDQTTTSQKPNPKDPSRPRRKKARRACFACQRAHLTCGTLLLCTALRGLSAD